ncbi:MAG: sigma-54 dependent transcriptional regulator [Longimicrobiales bacterium]|nr:sigma-54 dependent transcriptional regulator [Longimicrobiales bacterium]
MTGRILIVDDEEGLREALADKLRADGFEVETADSAETALARVNRVDPDLVLTDLRMPGISGLELTARLRENRPRTDVIVMTGHEDMSSAVDAMKAGAFDYLVKPVRLAEVTALVERCLREQELDHGDADEDAESSGEDADSIDEPRIVGRDPRMIEIFKMIGVLARNRATVLVRGETGTGKELIAHAIHDHSQHAKEPFIAVNCTAVSETLLESELFGHVKGAFTGAVSSRRGYFELAGSGTIFLDEIGDTSPDFQAKLLRVLQERTFYPVGGEQPRTTEARVVAATHQPLEELVEEGSFREDLYFRLRVVEIVVPPLRERRGDIPDLARALLARIRAETGGEVERIEDAALERLEAHRWKGNVRELENVLTRAAIVARGRTITEAHLHLEVAPAVSGKGAGEDALDSIIATHLRDVLERTGGNRSEAARALEVSRSRLQRLIDRLEIRVDG